MNLITMAHMGEAQAFIEGLNLVKVRENFFTSGETALLLTGEGPFEAAIKTAEVLAEKKYLRILNAGIAGALNTGLKKDDIFEIRSSYLFLDGPQFKSFPLSSKGLDCLTSFKRVLDPQSAQEMRGVASLVDRELWGVAMSAKSAGVSLRSFKLISDLAGAESVCDIALENSRAWSQSLFTHLLPLLDKTEEQKTSLELEGFYFTFSAQHQLTNLLERLRIKEGFSLASLNLEDFIERSTNPKDRAKLLLQYLEQRLDPIKGQIASQILEWKKPLETQGLRVEVDPKWESSAVKFFFEAKTNDELKSKAEALEKFSLTPFQDILDGKIHVE
jgi:hypothetical protein